MTSPNTWKCMLKPQARGSFLSPSFLSLTSSIWYESKVFSSIFPSGFLGNPSHHLHPEDLRPPFLLAWLTAASSYLTSSSTLVSTLIYSFKTHFSNIPFRCLPFQHGTVLFLPSVCSTETFFLPVLSPLPSIPFPEQIKPPLIAGPQPCAPSA